MRPRALITLIGGAAVAWSLTASAQHSPGLEGCSQPVSQRTDEEPGCYVTAVEHLGSLRSGSVYWHIYTYPSRAAAEAVERPNGSVVETFGRVWLYVIAEQGWRASSGERVAVLGPFPIVADKQYVARYMEEVREPGPGPPEVRFEAHRHSGPEAFYVVSGGLCLETPAGTTVARAGEGTIVPEGPPMTPEGVGTEMLRHVFVVLHEASRSWMTMEDSWKPKGLCAAQR
jgi:hypothetical protein